MTRVDHRAPLAIGNSSTLHNSGHADGDPTPRKGAPAMANPDQRDHEGLGGAERRPKLVHKHGRSRTLHSNGPFPLANCSEARAVGTSLSPQLYCPSSASVCGTDDGGLNTEGLTVSPLEVHFRRLSPKLSPSQGHTKASNSVALSLTDSPEQTVFEAANPAQSFAWRLPRTSCLGETLGQQELSGSLYGRPSALPTGAALSSTNMSPVEDVAGTSSAGHTSVARPSSPPSPTLDNSKSFSSDCASCESQYAPSESSAQGSIPATNRFLSQSDRYCVSRKWWAEPVDGTSRKDAMSALESAPPRVAQRGDQYLAGKALSQSRGLIKSSQGLGEQESPGGEVENTELSVRLTGDTCRSYPKSLPSLWMTYHPEVINYHVLMMYAAAAISRRSPFELVEALPSSTRGDNSAVSDSVSGTSLVDSTPERNQKPVSRRRRILDIGCGSSAPWCVGVLKSYADVEVVGLDVLPVSPEFGQLGAGFSGRFSFVQHNFRAQVLPFADQSFDYVRAAFIAPGMPETHWAPLIEDMLRIIKSGCPLELLENDLVVANARGSGTVEAIGPVESQICPAFKSLKSSPGDYNSQLNRNKAVEKDLGSITINRMIIEILDRAFVSSYPLSVIPAQLSMSATGMQRPLLNYTVKFPAGPEAVSAQSTERRRRNSGSPNLENVAAECASEDEAIGRVILQSHVDAIQAHKDIFWDNFWLPLIEGGHGQRANPQEKRDAFNGPKSRTGEERTVGNSGSSMPGRRMGMVSAKLPGAGVTNGGGHFGRPARSARELRMHRGRVDQTWSNWRESLDSNTIGLGRLLESRFGWTCKMDYEHHDLLDRQYRCYQAEIRKCDQELTMLRTMALYDESAQNEVQTDLVLSHKEALKKLMQSIRTDLLSLKKRLGLADQAMGLAGGAVVLAANETNDISHNPASPHHTWEGEGSPEPERRGSNGSADEDACSTRPEDDFGRMNIERFIAFKA